MHSCYGHLQQQRHNSFMSFWSVIFHSMRFYPASSVILDCLPLALHYGYHYHHRNSNLLLLKKPLVNSLSVPWYYSLLYLVLWASYGYS